MRPIVVTEFITLDGVIEAPGGGDHPHAGWTFKDVEFDEAAYEIKGREMGEATALMFGRQSYDEFAPRVAVDGGVRDLQRDAQVRRLHDPPR